MQCLSHGDAEWRSQTNNDVGGDLAQLTDGCWFQGKSVEEELTPCQLCRELLFTILDKGDDTMSFSRQQQPLAKL